jgi:hypothetical protein
MLVEFAYHEEVRSSVGNTLDSTLRGPAMKRDVSLP